MENRFLCRGKRLDNGEWVVGHYYEVMGKSYIFEPHFTSENLTYEVDPSTICQCTGYDEIYEKDIFQCDEERYLIVWNDSSLSWEAQSVYSSESISLGEFSPTEIEVIGNEIDNQELLEVQS